MNDIATAANLSTSNGLVTPRDGHPIFSHDLAFKAFEIEELADIYFFRPLGFLVARCAALLRMTPTQVTLLGALVGIAGGTLLYDQRLGLVAFVILILHGIIDSADGQLARMTGRATELGRVLDGVGGYVTHAAIYIAIAVGVISRGGSGIIFVWMGLAALANTAQAQMYEYHRTGYATVVIKRQAPRNDPTKVSNSFVRFIFRGYLAVQSFLAGKHAEVEAVIVSRATADSVRDDDRARYRDCFYKPVRGWNLFGDNTRFYAIGVLAYLHRIDLFFAFVLLPMNVAFIAFWIWQERADRRFLASL